MGVAPEMRRQLGNRTRRNVHFVEFERLHALLVILGGDQRFEQRDKRRAAQIGRIVFLAREDLGLDRFIIRRDLLRDRGRHRLGELVPLLGRERRNHVGHLGRTTRGKDHLVHAEGIRQFVGEHDAFQAAGCDGSGGIGGVRFARFEALTEPRIARLLRLA